MNYTSDKDQKKEAVEVTADVTTLKDDLEVNGMNAEFINLRTTGWVQAIPLILKVQIGLGVLSIASTLTSLGYALGTVVLVFIGFLTTYSNVIISNYVQEHPEIDTVSDIGYSLFKRPGKEIFEVAFCIYMIMIVSSGLLGMSTALSQLSDNGACSVIFVSVMAIVVFLLASLHQARYVSYAAWFGVGCIIVSVMIVTIAVAVADRPAAAPVGEYNLGLTASVKGSFVDVMSGISTIIFAYGGLPAFIPIMKEMKQEKDFTKSLYVGQGITTVFYIIVSLVVYTYCGQYISSPVLGSAGTIIKKISYGIAFSGLLAGAVVVAHLLAKSLFVRIFKRSQHLYKKSARHYVYWMLTVAVGVVVAYIVANCIPYFDLVISLVGAIFMTFFVIVMPGLVFLMKNDNQKNRVECKKTPWTAEEDATLLNLYEVDGPLWTKISSSLPGRSALNCRNRYRKFGGKVYKARKLSASGSKKDYVNSDSQNESTDGSTFDVHDCDSKSSDISGSNDIENFNVVVARMFPQLVPQDAFNTLFMMQLNAIPTGATPIQSDTSPMFPEEAEFRQVSLPSSSSPLLFDFENVFTW
ncbi:hypothetical protein E3Q14_04095 [Wallemia mellicola]|nr:hypothetical protein E3Q14_04095 [Wallemia mellicola]